MLSDEKMSEYKQYVLTEGCMPPGYSHWEAIDRNELVEFYELIESQTKAREERRTKKLAEEMGLGEQYAHAAWLDQRVLAELMLVRHLLINLEQDFARYRQEHAADVSAVQDRFDKRLAAVECGLRSISSSLPV